MALYTDIVNLKPNTFGYPITHEPEYYFRYEELDRTSDDAWDHKVEFKHKGKMHRLDGPAIIAWHKFKKGHTRLYYVEGTILEQDKYLFLMHCPLEVLPLYITIPHYSEIVRHRLAGSKTEIEMKNSQLLTRILPHLKCPEPSAGSNPFKVRTWEGFKPII